MKIIEPSAVIEAPAPTQAFRDYILGLIERAGRTCYKSEGKITDGSASEFVRKLVQVRKHESVLEHATATVRFIVDRGVSHELVRHRLSAFSQESTRYCNYADEKFGKEITVIRPCFWGEPEEKYDLWEAACETAEYNYFALLERGATPQEARAILPNSLKTELVMTCNLRQWRHVLNLRALGKAGTPHPQMVQVMKPLLGSFQEWLPEIFGDLK